MEAAEENDKNSNGVKGQEKVQVIFIGGNILVGRGKVSVGERIIINLNIY